MTINIARLKNVENAVIGNPVQKTLEQDSDLELHPAFPLADSRSLVAARPDPALAAEAAHAFGLRLPRHSRRLSRPEIAPARTLLEFRPRPFRRARRLPQRPRLRPARSTFSRFRGCRHRGDGRRGPGCTSITRCDHREDCTRAREPISPASAGGRNALPPVVPERSSRSPVKRRGSRTTRIVRVGCQ